MADIVFGNLFLKPWYDRAAVRLLSGVFFPLGRAWAAAEAAGTDETLFEAEVGGAERSRVLVRRALARAQDLREAHRAAYAAWESAVFDGVDPGEVRRAAAERWRARSAFRYMAARGSFVPLHALSPFPKVHTDIAGPLVTRNGHGWRLETDEPFAPLDDPGSLERSRDVTTDLGSVSWLRGLPDRDGGRAWARVTVVPGDPGRPVLILSHGISMEDEYWGMNGRATGAAAGPVATEVKPCSAAVRSD